MVTVPAVPGVSLYGRPGVVVFHGCSFDIYPLGVSLETPPIVLSFPGKWKNPCPPL